MSQPNAATPSSTWRTQEILIGGIQHAAGVALLLAAWVLVFTDHARAAGSALLPGLLIVTLYGANQIRFRAVLERAVLIVGAWTLVAPWALGFAANDGATWSHVALGGVAIATAVALLRIARRP
ncbi:SPW repeat protein [Methylobacterium sp. C1]|uniref:SPW repeat protein n=1 Tax=Methylobacterium sp. C1 TaxID=1479019 RepID=UPI0008D90DA4|nr:SPW repeat protein [Methylobacterium sp. C1]